MISRRSFVMNAISRILVCSLFFLLSHSKGSLAASCANANGQVYVPPTFSLDQSTAEYISCDKGFDGPKISSVNETVYDWWYFDAVSKDGTESVVVIFFTASELGFPFEVSSVVMATTVTVFATYADGTSSLNFLLAPGGAKITTKGNGASGEWIGAGSTFSGASDLSRYTVSVDNPTGGVKGTLSLDSLGPGHFPCSPLGAGVNEELIDNVGWANVLPAATGEVDFTINGKEIKFSGHGYHDKNWGDKPFSAAVQSWYWGHGTMGPYNLVWFDAIDHNGVESVSGYVLKDGEVVGSTCDALAVRPVGTPYPPTLLSLDPDQYTIKMKLNDGTKLSATVSTVATQINVVEYIRWIGTIEGTVGDEAYTGSALWEEFRSKLA